MQNTRNLDRELLRKMSKDRLIDLIFLHLRNYWAVDGLYFLGIEEKYGTQGANEIDKNVWKVMGKIEARKIQNEIGIQGKEINTVIDALRLSGWALDLEYKEIEINDKKAIIRNRNCRVQNTRVKKGMSEFPCKNVRLGFLESFVKEFNPEIKIICNVCPPDKHSEDLWCEWEIKIHENEIEKN